MKVTVFGGALPKAGEPVYEMAYALGGMLANAGHTVLNGGYIGTMEAVSRGAFEEGGRVVGVTCDQIEDWRKIAPNDFITNEVRFSTLKERLDYLMDQCEAAVALPGGLGTMVEISLLWNEIAIEAKPKVPIILVGIGWEETFEAFFDNLGEFVRKEDRELLQFVTSVTEVVPLLKIYQAGLSGQGRASAV
jgi:uncharacterized protein (TIGR00730 family)